MKQALLIASAACFVTGAQAADMAARPYTKAPPLVETSSWAGFYVGFNAGAGWTDTNVTTGNTPGVPAAIFGLPANIAALNAAGTVGLSNKVGFSGGAQAGYNWQMQRIVFGVEADISSMSKTSNVVIATTTTGPLAISNSIRGDYLATFRGRFGGLVTDQTLLYVTGGAAVSDLKYTQTVSGTLVPSGVVTGGATASNTKVGWTVGGGVEQAFAPNWTIKGEYLYARFDGLNTAYVATGAATGSTQNLTAGTNRINEQVARVGINYRFGGPVVARY